MGQLSRAAAQKFKLNTFKHYLWLKNTQKGRNDNVMWRGTTEDHCLASGLDDYPRSSPPSLDIDEHVDLVSWLLAAARLVQQVNDMDGLGRHKDNVVSSLVAGDMQMLERKLDRLFTGQYFSDWGTSKKPQRPAVQGLTNHCGYVSIMPLLLQLLRPSDYRLGRLLEVLGDHELFWSDHGIRSLCHNHVLFGTKEDYWRGPVWMNMNYLALSALHVYARLEGPHADQAAQLFARLRVNVSWLCCLTEQLVDTVSGVYRNKTSVFESYDSETGAGRGPHPFTGWTSLVVLILSDDYVDLTAGQFGAFRCSLDHVYLVAEKSMAMHEIFLFLKFGLTALVVCGAVWFVGFYVFDSAPGPKKRHVSLAKARRIANGNWQERGK